MEFDGYLHPLLLFNMWLLKATFRGDEQIFLLWITPDYLIRMESEVFAQQTSQFAANGSIRPFSLTKSYGKISEPINQMYPNVILTLLETN